jgi:hypothetical protein
MDFITEEEKTSEGKPTTKALEELMERNLTASDRDAMWEVHEAENKAAATAMDKALRGKKIITGEDVLKAKTEAKAETKAEKGE